MPATPNITLTATLLDYSGNIIGSANNPAWLRIGLAGYGPVLPTIPGTGSLAKISSWFLDLPFSGAPISVNLWGNDQITPAGTYYAISVLDTQRNVVQTGIYQFNGGPLTIDLSSAPQISPPIVPPLPFAKAEALSGAIPGTAYSLSSQTFNGLLLGLFLNGLFLRPGIDYVSPVSGTAVTLNFSTQAGDNLYAVYVAI